MLETFLEELDEHAAVVAASRALISDAQRAAEMMVAAIQAGGTILFCGNGGSAADGGHIVGELVGRFLAERRPLRAIALSDSVAAMTAIANDYSYEEVFARQVRAFGDESSVLFALSTSGNSVSILNAAEAAREVGTKVVGMTGQSGGKLASLCDLCVRVPTDVTRRIQEVHMLLGHSICRVVEERLFPATENSP
jgi:D-sedoheptulose 7-phosphate isomerase